MTDEEKKQRKREASKRWRQNHKEYAKAYNREHRDQLNEYSRKRYAENAEAAREKSRIYYAEHPEYRERSRVQSREWRKANEERHCQLNKEWEKNNVEASAEIRSRSWDNRKDPVVYAYTEGDATEYCYIGSTVNMAHRIQHRKCKTAVYHYFDATYRERPDDFHLVVLQHFEDIKEARKKEAELIGRLKPKYNVCHAME